MPVIITGLSPCETPLRNSSVSCLPLRFNLAKKVFMLAKVNILSLTDFVCTN